jgi:hypothetical protein
MNPTPQTPADEDPDAFLAEADEPAELPDAASVVERKRRLDAVADAQADTMGKRPVDSGSRQHPQLRAIQGEPRNSAGKKR